VALDTPAKRAAWLFSAGMAAAVWVMLLVQIVCGR
jgi:hypothetical protein